MSIADCKRGRRKFYNDDRYNRQMRRDPEVRARKAKEAVEREQLMKRRKK